MNKGFWLFYTLQILGVYTIVGVAFSKTIGIGLGLGVVWTTVNLLHAVASWLLLHASKGAPFWLPGDQGEYDTMTFWEQIDRGNSYTSNKKFLSVV
jgi:hypothetical protein